MTPPSIVETAHGPLHLPVYFPDATRGVVRTVDSRDLEDCGVQGLVVNVFHLSTRPGAGLIKRAGGIHDFMAWRRPIASDSGGFQLMSMIRENARYGTISRRGITSPTWMAPEKRPCSPPSAASANNSTWAPI